MPPGMLMPLAGRANRLLRRVPTAVVWLGGLGPALWLVWALFNGRLGPDPVRPLEHELGIWSLRFLIAALCVTPILRASGLNLIRFRRALGVLGFGYAALHLVVWLLLDIQLRWDEIARDLVKRPYITVGMLALALLVPLALTSTDGAIRRMGAAAWRRLHLLAWPATLAGALHYMLVVKAWPPEPMVYLAIVIGLLLLRLGRIRRARTT
ncbi:protein-methionine-sulfoxide reductase heme-binding subunit MsrQ [Gemmobacter sp.]|uniref:protein-methionine-sulfoxide reductase heme-binding subunit MsrQ n=1 Tax=Gemmobacter sp. TaxID=1898957 RepID=UPI002AFF7440|nr:protein-methionine-sulfoxide reductase heme-binding subunit MsrQ [Gemmobacter sp.]